MKGLFRLLVLAIYRSAAGEVSGSLRYYDELVQWAPIPGDDLKVLGLIDSPKKETQTSLDAIKATCSGAMRRVGILINGNFNHSYDIQQTLSELKGVISRDTRLFIIAYNPYFEGLFRLLNRWGLRDSEVPTTFMTFTDLKNLAQLSGYAVLQNKGCGIFPFRLFGLGTWIDRILLSLPLVNGLAPVSVIVLRPILASKHRPSLTILIPARNERGNIENALKRLPNLGTDLEVIYVEGHSNDGTWEEIQRVIPLYERPGLRIRAFQQTGKGKNDAVRLGFSHATADLLTILDADLTMPPELLGRFYEAYRSGLADFVNGSRLVYPMEGEAMRFLNHLGNVFFAKALSFVLQTKIGDSLCGTKLLARHDYERFVRWRKDFGDFDPFGDFELLFPASILHLGIVDIPVRYRARTYGTTNIRRFRDGWLLLKMTLIGFFELRVKRFNGSHAR